MSTVAIERSDQAIQGTGDLLNKLDFSKKAKNKTRVLIKPNLTTSAGPETGITSDVRIVEAIIELLLDLGVENISIGEGAGGAQTMHAFEKNGYVALGKKYDLPVLDLNFDESVLLDVPEPLSMGKVRVSKTVYDSDFRISVAKLKIHSIAVTTGTMKNMMGVLSGRRWKLIVHSDIHNRIVDLNKVVLPHFGVIDGVVGNQRDEVKSYPIEAGVLIAGFDPVAVDSIASEIMAVPWREVPHLVLAQQAGLGIADSAKIEILGPRVEDVRQQFDRRVTVWAKARTGAQIFSGRVWQTVEGAGKPL
ncbi:MAG: DUF362 domain-containing protein [Thermoplasmata archaeon]